MHCSYDSFLYCSLTRRSDTEGKALQGDSKCNSSWGRERIIIRWMLISLNLCSQRWRAPQTHKKRYGLQCSSLEASFSIRKLQLAGNCVPVLAGFVIDVCANIPAWPGREVEDGSHQRAYFGIRTPERLIEFECKKCDKGIWIEGIRQMLDCRANMNIAKAM
ncbi:hypothetical protein B296_00028598 [Ensete ventricosum]|uniref:Pleckstrin-like plant domain-containing protein n=1 Tax=Ensete ventricosum TaxID=4639 RepID=A0A426Z0B4_ENSVE|nr:hypothetical protein B296_00028598 [Ensete ventricosum]